MVPMTEPTTDTAALAASLPLAGRRIIDVGCGEGAMVRWLRAQGADVTGFECGEVMRGRALTADPGHGADYVDAGAQDLPLPDGSVDVVCFFRSLHHVPAAEMATALDEAARVLRPGGVAYIVEPVAAGANFEVARLVDDETEVRALAQAAIARAASGAFVLDQTTTYTTRSSYPDVAAWEHHVVGIDPQRAQALQDHREEVVRRFHELAIPTDQGFAFDQEQRVAILRKAG
jgi:ubiquinone/menaquinone biosynthesis C-methylase UbiE